MKETAELLGVSTKTVRNMILADIGFPALQLNGKGSAIRIPADELADWLESDPEGAA